MSNTFGKRLRMLRQEKDLFAEDLAELLNTTQATISRYENGLRIPKIDFVVDVAKFFKVPTDYLVGLTDNREIWYPATNLVVDEIRKNVAKFGHDISNKSTDEIAEMIYKYLKIEEINKE